MEEEKNKQEAARKIKLQIPPNDPDLRRKWRKEEAIGGYDPMEIFYDQPYDED